MALLCTICIFSKLYGLKGDGEGGEWMVLMMYGVKGDGEGGRWMD